MDAALQLLNQYSIAGTVVPLSYNAQADTDGRMINLINDAQMQIATTVKPIPEIFEYEVPEIDLQSPMEDIAVQMPDDFNHFLSLTFTPARGFDRRSVEPRDYKWLPNDVLLLPNRPAGTYRIDYNRFPERYEPDVDRSKELDNSPDTHEIIPYFVASMMCVGENTYAYTSFYNVWETKLTRLGAKPAYAANSPNEDVYGFHNWGW